MTFARRFDGIAAIITGGAGGIGSAIAKRLAQEGAMVLLTDMDGEKVQMVAAEINASSPELVIGQQCDVRIEDHVARCFGTALERFARVDVVVNNAGIMTFNSIAKWSSKEWLDVLQVDLLGAALFTKFALQNVGDEGGAIVNVASIHALMTTALAAPDAAAKAGLVSLTRSTAHEGKSHGVRANAVLPGAIDTRMLWSNPNVQSGREKIDKADVGTADDIAAAVAFLASAEARFINGTSLVVDGGRLAAL